jgi:hypothetical protein
LMIWRIGFSHMALLKVGGHFTVPGFRVCSILYISCLYILISVVTKLETSKSMQNTNPLGLKPHTGKTEFFRPCLCRFFCCFEVWWQCQLPHPPMSPLFLTLYRVSSLQCSSSAVNGSVFCPRTNTNPWTHGVSNLTQEKTQLIFALVCAGSSVALRCDDAVSCCLPLMSSWLLTFLQSLFSPVLALLQ